MLIDTTLKIGAKLIKKYKNNSFCEKKVSYFCFFLVLL